MDFAERGGPTLMAYPHFARIRRDNFGRWCIASDALARCIAPISARLRRMARSRCSSSGESTLARWRRASRQSCGRGDSFVFAGRVLQFVRFHQMILQVRRGKGNSGIVPRWMGGKLPMSSSLATAVRLRLEQAAHNEFVDDEMRHIRPILELQRRWSQIPSGKQLLIESIATRDGQHHYVFPFQGRRARRPGGTDHISIARRGSGPVTATFNDYGIEFSLRCR